METRTGRERTGRPGRDGEGPGERAERGERGAPALRGDELERQGPSFLAEASRLLADTLDYEATLSTVARLALPHLGSWCIVDIVEEDGGIRRLAIIHPEADKAEMVNELKAGWPPDRKDPLGVPAVALTRRSEVVPEVTDAWIRQVARNDRNLELLRGLGIGSLMSVPLLARGDVLGAMTFVAPEYAHHYTGDDLSLAEDLAARAAIAIDNARLFRRAERARESAELASQAKSQFLGVMSHELRTPINAILGYTQLLDMGVKGPLEDSQRELLERVEVSARHLLDMVTRILDVSRAETGELTVQNQVTLVDEVIGAAIKEVRPELLEGLLLENACDGNGALRFHGDAIRARQVVTHLLTNACRFTPEGGVIRVSCDRVTGPVGPERLRGSGPWVRIDVEDNGIGIPSERQEAVFEPFVQGDDTRYVRSVDGSGLGLAISRYLARLMGGDLTLRSQPGVGSCFSLWLPAPAELSELKRDRRLFDREAEGLDFLSEHLLGRLKPLMETYVDRLRRDGGIPRAREASDVELRDHIPHFISGVASVLSHAGRADNETSAVLRGGNAIQRMILELHGTQRRRLGWSEDAVRRDLELLRQTIELDIRRIAPRRKGLRDAMEVLSRLFDQAIRISVQGWHFAGEETLRHREGDGDRPGVPDDAAVVRQRAGVELSDDESLFD